MRQHLESKTVFGLLVLLGVVVGLALVGKLTEDVVAAIKWIGSTYFGVRTAANIMENLPSQANEDSSSSDGKAS